MVNLKSPKRSRASSRKIGKTAQAKIRPDLVESKPSTTKFSKHVTFLSTASFRPPEKIVASAWLEHAPFAFWLVEKLKPKILVELGTHNGFSYFAFCQAMRMAGLSVAAFAVDHWAGDEHAGFYNEDVYRGVECYNREHYSDISTLMKMTFADALQYFEDGSIDLLHIDGRHHFEDVKTDFESWLPKLSDRGVVLFHDINVRERQFGAHRFWSEVRRIYPSFSFLHCHGLGVLGVGTKPPTDVAALFDASGDEAVTASIRNAYARLGGAVTLAFQNSEAARHRAEAAETVDELLKEREALQRRIEELADDQSRLREEAEKTANELKDELGSAFAMLSAERQRAAEKSDRIDELQRLQESLLAELAASKEDAHATEERAACNNKVLSAANEALLVDRAQLAVELESQQRQLAEMKATLNEFIARDEQTEATIEEAEGALQNAAQTQQSQLKALAEARRSIQELTEVLRQVEAEASAAKSALVEAASHNKELMQALEEVGREKAAALRKLMIQSKDTEAINFARIDAERKSQDLIYELESAQRKVREVRFALTETAASLEGSRAALDAKEAARAKLAEALNEADEENRALSSDLEQTAMRLDEVEKRADERASTQEAAYAQALAERERLDEGRLRDLRDQLVDAEAALNAATRRLGEGSLAKILPAALRKRMQVRRLVRSGLLDSSWYCATYPDVSDSGLAAAEHYLQIGFCRGYRPNPFFDTRWYLERYEDVRRSGINPLLHYSQYGWREGRDPGPNFHTNYYLEANGDVLANRLNPLAHYLHHGRNEGRLPVRPT